VFYLVLGRMVDNGHDDNLMIAKSQGSPTFVVVYEHLKDFEVKCGDGVNGGNLPNKLAIEEVVDAELL
jgi:hypothetical protein